MADDGQAGENEVMAGGSAAGAETPADSAAENPRRRFEDLPPAAQRALKEAEARRAAYEEADKQRAREIGGRGGKEPVRYGDYEVKGIAIDF